MNRPHDSVEHLIRNSRPTGRVDFVESVEGAKVLSRILEGSPQVDVKRSRRKAPLIGAVVLAGLLGAGATAAVGGYFAPTAPPEALPASGDAFMCATAGMERMADVRASAGEAPVDACRRQWPGAFGVDAPAHLFSCVQRVTPAPSPAGSGQPAPSDSASPAAWGRLVYVVEGGQFTSAGETCGSVGMLVAPSADDATPSLPASPS